MDEREAELVQLLDWLLRQKPTAGGDYIDTEALYTDDDEAAHRVLAQLAELEERRLIEIRHSLGGPQPIKITSHGRQAAADHKAMRENRAAREAAVRNGIVGWLHDRDATEDTGQMPPISEFFTDHRSIFGGYMFEFADVDRATSWLQRHEMVQGIAPAESPGLQRLYLREAGVICAERYGSDVAAYVAASEERERGGSTSVTVNNYGSMNAPVAIAGRDAHQTVDFRTTEGLAEAVQGIVAIVRVMQLVEVEDVPVLDRYERHAIDDLTADQPDLSTLTRLRGWLVDHLRAGTDTAVNAAIVLALDSTVQQAAHVIGQIPH